MTQLVSTYRVVDHERLMQALPPADFTIIGIAATSAGWAGIGERVPCAALVPSGTSDLTQLLASSDVSAAWTIERGYLDGFFADPAAHPYIRRGVPILLVFEDDYARLLSVVPGLPLLPAEQDRFDEARQDAALEPRDEAEIDETYRQYDDLDGVAAPEDDR